MKELTEKKTDWLVLVNGANKLPDGFAETVELVWCENPLGERFQIEKNTYAAFLRLKEDLMKNDGIHAELSNSYRTVEKQNSIFQKYTNDFGLAYAEKYAARPGHSEHHTGLAIDMGIVVDGKFHRSIKDLLSVDHLFRIVHQKLAAYGFILRYPEGKEAITKIGYEPWHFRYLHSPEIARQITEQGLCLEEYLEKVK